MHIHLSNGEYISEKSQSDHKPEASFTQFHHDCKWVLHSFFAKEVGRINTWMKWAELVSLFE